MMEFLAEQIAAVTGGTVEGNPKVALRSFAKIEEAGEGDLAFLANPKYTNYIYSTKASAVLVSNDFKAEQALETTLIRVANPYETLATLMRMVDQLLNPQPTGIEEPSHIGAGVTVDENCYIGAFSYIADGVSLGAGVKVYPHVYIGRGASIGDGTILYSGAKVYPGCKIGKSCIIHSGAVIGADGFGFAPNATGSYDKIPQMGIVVLGDNVEVGANTTVDRATMGATLIGDGSKLDNLVQVAHNVEVGANTVIAAQAGFAGSSKVGNNCMIGGQVGVAGHISIGNKVSIGAQSGIPNNVADGSVLMGYPAVPARNFARQAAALKRLPDLMSRMNALLRQAEKEN